jgi:hypothetical protein
MGEKTPSRSTTASPSTDASGDSGADQVQQKFDKAAEQGFFGVEIDQTPNENYTLQGGPAGEGTPEGDRMQGKDQKGR